MLARLELDGDETVLDAGCGSGRVTRLLLDRLPDGKVIGVDGAPSMIELAREQLAGYGERIELILSDLNQLVLPAPVDAIFSNATFHWILDHDLLFARLHEALRPGGQFEVQFGGQDNVAEWKRAIEAAEGDERFSAYLRGMPDTHNFASVGDTHSRLERAGFDDRLDLAREPHGHAPRPGPVRSRRRSREAHEADAREPSRRVRRRRPRLVAEAADARVRAAQRLGEEAPVSARSGAVSAIVLLPGDGIGPEIVSAARRVLDAVGEFSYEEQLVGGASIDAHGTALTDDVLAACRAADAVLLGAVGGPKWDTTDPDAPRPEQGLLGLRKGLGLYANLRPVKPIAALIDASPLREDRIAGVDLLVVRELTGGIYFGEKTRTETSASDTCLYSAEEIERIARVAFEAAGTPPRPRHLRRQGERPRDVPPLARDGRAGRRRLPRGRARAHARRQHRDAARRGAGALRRDRDREHVR